jgi:hypothetical protein
MHDAFGRDWPGPHFAVCDSLEASEVLVFGDVMPVAVETRKRVAKRKLTRGTIIRGSAAS